MSASAPHSSLDLQEQITRIDHLIAQTQKAQAELGKMTLDMGETWLDMRLAPWQLMAAGATSGAALFAAGAAFVKLTGG